MKCSFHPKAKDEFLEAIDYYKSCGTDLDLEFVNEIYSTIQRIIQFPTALIPT
jgi:plasmid stabilization system protein ParE